MAQQETSNSKFARIAQGIGQALEELVSLRAYREARDSMGPLSAALGEVSSRAFPAAWANYTPAQLRSYWDVACDELTTPKQREGGASLHSYSLSSVAKMLLREANSLMVASSAESLGVRIESAMHSIPKGPWVYSGALIGLSEARMLHLATTRGAPVSSLASCVQVNSPLYLLHTDKVFGSASMDADQLSQALRDVGLELADDSLALVCCAETVSPAFVKLSRHTESEALMGELHQNPYPMVFEDKALDNCPEFKRAQLDRCLSPLNIDGASPKQAKTLLELWLSSSRIGTRNGFITMRPLDGPGWERSKETPEWAFVQPINAQVLQIPPAQAIREKNLLGALEAIRSEYRVPGCRGNTKEDTKTAEMIELVGLFCAFYSKFQHEQRDSGELRGAELSPAIVDFTLSDIRARLKGLKLDRQV